VAVPTHFFKAVLAEARGPGGEQTLVGAWVLPNAAVRAPAEPPPGPAA